MKLHPFGDGRPAWRVLLVMLLRVWLVAALLLWAAQEVLIFPGLYLQLGEDPHARALEMEAEVHSLDADDGGTCTLWTCDRGADRVVLMVHGNGELVADMWGYAQTLEEAGWDWAGIELRGFKGAPGWPGEASGAADVRRALTELRERYDPARIVVHGRSIGGGIATAGLSEPAVAGLVLESTFDSVRAVAQRRLPIFPVSLLLRHPLDTAYRLEGRSLPVLQVHDSTDRVVPIERAMRLREVLEEGTWVQTDRWPHGTALVLAEPAIKEQWLGWLEQRVPGSDRSPPHRPAL